MYPSDLSPVQEQLSSQYKEYLKLIGFSSYLVIKEHVKTEDKQALSLRKLEGTILTIFKHASKSYVSVAEAAALYLTLSESQKGEVSLTMILGTQLIL